MGAPSSFGAVSLEGRGAPPRSGGAHPSSGRAMSVAEPLGRWEGRVLSLKSPASSSFPVRSRRPRSGKVRENVSLSVWASGSRTTPPEVATGLAR